MTTSCNHFDFSSKQSTAPESIDKRRSKPVSTRPPSSAAILSDNAVTGMAIGAAETAQASGAIPLVFVEPVICAQQTYTEWLQERLKQSRLMTYFVTFWVHWMAVLCMGALFFSEPVEFPPITLNAIFSEDEPDHDVLLEYVDLSLEIPSHELAATPDAVLNSETLAMSVPSPTLDEVSLVTLPGAILALASNSERNTQPAESIEPVEHKANSKPMVVPRHAVAAGSFVVWTEPENPDPGEPYRIVIQIRLPAGTERYSVTDLEGVVVGSDGYQKLIPGPLRGFLPVQDGIVKLEVHIVSADKNVQDTVVIRSKLLREAQRLKIQF